MQDELFHISGTLGSKEQMETIYKSRKNNNGSRDIKIVTKKDGKFGIKNLHIDYSNFDMKKDDTSIQGSPMEVCISSDDKVYDNAYVIGELDDERKRPDIFILWNDDISSLSEVMFYVDGVKTELTPKRLSDILSRKIHEDILSEYSVEETIDNHCWNWFHLDDEFTLSSKNKDNPSFDINYDAVFKYWFMKQVHSLSIPPKKEEEKKLYEKHPFLFDPQLSLDEKETKFRINAPEGMPYSFHMDTVREACEFYIFNSNINSINYLKSYMQKYPLLHRVVDTNDLIQKLFTNNDESSLNNSYMSTYEDIQNVTFMLNFVTTAPEELRVSTLKSLMSVPYFRIGVLDLILNEMPSKENTESLAGDINSPYYNTIKKAFYDLLEHGRLDDIKILLDDFWNNGIGESQRRFLESMGGICTTDESDGTVPYVLDKNHRFLIGYTFDDESKLGNEGSAYIAFATKAKGNKIGLDIIDEYDRCTLEPIKHETLTILPDAIASSPDHCENFRFFYQTEDNKGYYVNDRIEKDECLFRVSMIDDDWGGLRSHYTNFIWTGYDGEDYSKSWGGDEEELPGEDEFDEGDYDIDRAEETSQQGGRFILNDEHPAEDVLDEEETYDRNEIDENEFDTNKVDAIENNGGLFITDDEDE